MSRSNIIVLVVVGLIVLGAALYTLRDKDAPPQEVVSVEMEERTVDAPVPPDESAIADRAEDNKGAVAEAVEEEQEAFIPKVAEEVAPEELVLPDNASIEQKFEFVLNTMLRDVAAKAQGYKEKRKVLRELAQPENLRTKEDVEENFVLVQELVPQLYAEAADIFKIFSAADEQINVLAQGRSEAERAAILNKWSTLKRENAGAYHDFFALEEDVIKAHERLLRFYFVKREFFSFDRDTGEIVFQNENDQRLARKLDLRVNRLDRTQGRALSVQ